MRSCNAFEKPRKGSVCPLLSHVENHTSNDWGAENHFWTEQLEPALQGLEGARASETYTQTPEYDDLECFLCV